MIAGADLVDDRDEPLVARLVRSLRHELRVDQQQAARAAARAAATPLSTVARNSASSTPTSASLVPTCQITSSAQPVFSGALSRCSVLTASSPPTPAFLTSAAMPSSWRKLVLEALRIGVGGRAGADPLGRGRSDREDFERAVGAAVQAGELRPGFERRPQRSTPPRRRAPTRRRKRTRKQPRAALERLRRGGSEKVRGRRGGRVSALDPAGDGEQGGDARQGVRQSRQMLNP